MLIRFVLLYLATLALGDDKIHKRMSPDEVQQIFQTSHESVPDYEVVQFSVSRLVKRGTRSARLIRALHRIPFENINLSLWITPADGHLVGENTPVYIARANGGHVTYTERPRPWRNIGQLMEDPPSGASMMVTKDRQGRYHINGVVRGKRLVIRSLPNEMADRLLQNHPSRDRRSAYHVVFRQERSGRGNGRGQGNRVGGPSTAPATPIDDECFEPIPANQTVVYPEIMLVVDSTFYEINRNNVDNILAYAVTFWNGVDLFYRSLQEPKFRFNLKYIIIAETPEAVPYINNNMIQPDLFDSERAIASAGRYYFSLQRFPRLSYDVTFTMSRNGVTGDEQGIARYKGACRMNGPEKQVMNVALVGDNGAYEGVQTAAHEFGHLLGVRHDNGDREGCQPDDGYIMAPYTSEIEGTTHDFSICSIEYMQRFLNRGWSRCLFNKPVTVNPLKRTLPGQLKNRNHQCHMESLGNDCFDENNPNHQPCVRIYCLSGQICEEGRMLVADGTFCGRGKKCFHGHCVSGFPV